MKVKQVHILRYDSYSRPMGTDCGVEQLVSNLVSVKFLSSVLLKKEIFVTYLRSAGPSG